MIRRWTWALLLLAGLVTAGCQTITPREELPPKPALAPEWDAVAAVSFAERFAALGADAQRQEAGELMAAFARNHDDTARLRLALALGTPGSAVSDDVRAAALLEPLAAPGGLPRSSSRQLAAVLHAQIKARLAERRRGDTLKVEADTARAEASAAAKQSEAARNDVKELKELRAQLDTARKELELQRAQAEAARMQAEALRLQLEALKAVEKTMIERGAPPPPRSPK
jgi:hypothetical protein